MREHAVDIADFMSDNLFVSLKVKPGKFKNTNINKKNITAKILIYIEYRKPTVDENLEPKSCKKTGNSSTIKTS